MASQSDSILAYLQAGNTLTPLEALHRFGTLALHSRAAELREQGHLIHCELVTVNGKQVGRYSIQNAAPVVTPLAAPPSALTPGAAPYEQLIHDSDGKPMFTAVGWGPGWPPDQDKMHRR